MILVIIYTHDKSGQCDQMRRFCAVMALFHSNHLVTLQEPQNVLRETLQCQLRGFSAASRVDLSIYSPEADALENKGRALQL